MTKTMALTETLEIIQADTKGDEISMSDFVEALNSRGYGPLLVGPAIITILPTGAIPGVPDICALLIIFVSVQMLMGHSHPWLPSRLKSFSIDRQKFIDTLESAKPYTKKMDSFIYPRLTFLIQPGLKTVMAIVSIILSIAIMILGFIPFMAALPASGVLFMGLGLMARDGLLLALSIITCICSIVLLPYAISFVF